MQRKKAGKPENTAVLSTFRQKEFSKLHLQGSDTVPGAQDMRTLLLKCAPTPLLATLSPHGIKVMLGEIDGMKLIIGLESAQVDKRYILAAFPGRPRCLVSLLYPGVSHLELASHLQRAFSYAVDIDPASRPPITGGFVNIDLHHAFIAAYGTSVRYHRNSNEAAGSAILQLAEKIGFARLMEFAGK